jgi:hypothetical protein
VKDNQPRIDDPVEWGRQLILTNDHDPLYVGLTHWNVKGARLRRFLLAYWCCYSVGASWYISQYSGSRFWDMLETAAINEKPAPIGGRWPRAHERRHWRGQKCVESVWALSSRFRHPEEAVISLEVARSLNDVNQLMNWPQFGPWIAFKAADMLERVLGVGIDFPDEVITLYKDPKEGAEMAAAIMGLGSNTQQVVVEMLDAYGGMLAPGYGGNSARLVNIQEIETVLCKWKSARRGHYWIGLDTRDHLAELVKWDAQDLLAAYQYTKA